MAWFKCIGSIQGGTDISEIVRLTEDEWTNLQTKDNNKIYFICNGQNNKKDMIRKIYQGDRRILKKEDISEYEFWYEDLHFPYNLTTSSGYTHSADRYAFDTDISLFTTGNKNRSFELEFKIDPALSQQYGNIFANHSYVNGSVFQIFVDSSNKICVAYKTSGSEGLVSNSSGINTNVRVSFDRTDTVNVVCKIYINDVLDSTKTFTNFESSSVGVCRIGLYGTYSPFNGCIDYIGFKWLD